MKLDKLRDKYASPPAAPKPPTEAGAVIARAQVGIPWRASESLLWAGYRVVEDLFMLNGNWAIRFYGCPEHYHMDRLVDTGIRVKIGERWVSEHGEVTIVDIDRDLIACEGGGFLDLVDLVGAYHRASDALVGR